MSHLLKLKFGTDGWRGKIGEEFTPENVARLTQAFANFFKKRRGGTVILGFDRRRDSEESAKNAAEVLAGNGIQVHLSTSFSPSPCIAWATQNLKAKAGMIITASHNPPDWNGIKFKEEDGGAASPEYTGAIENEWDSLTGESRRLPLAEAHEEGAITPFKPTEAYVRGLKGLVPIAAIRRKGWRIAFDPLFGAGSGYLSRVLETDLTEIHADQDPNFGGLNPEPIEKNLRELIDLVRTKNLDIGLATDGDADRIGAVDEQGCFVDSHHIYALILRHLATVWKEGGLLVKTVSTSNMINRLAQKYRLEVVETPIGFKHICKKFRNGKILMGGEESGGIAVGRWLKERDGLMAGLLLLEIMTHHEKRLGELIDDLHREVGPHFISREDLHLDHSPAQVEKALSRKIDEIAGEKVGQVSQVDGTKFIFPSGNWLLIRPSGTEPVLRIYAEAGDPERVRRLIQAGKELLLS